MFNHVELGNRIIYARKLNNKTQTEVASILNIGQSAYSDIENGKRVLDVDELSMLSDFLNAPIAWLLGIDADDAFTDPELLKIEEYKRFLKSIRKS